MSFSILKFSSNVLQLVVQLILPVVVREFNFQGPYLQLALHVGLLAGVIFWGIGSDVWGRR